MRLGQLSRKLDVSTSDIVSFLASSNIVINEDSNTKIADEHASLVTKKYAPQLLEVIAQSISEEKEEVEETKIVIEPVDAENAELPELTEQLILPEVIKAPKIELSGLKVLGKIEIPEKKKKEIVTDAAENENDKQPRPTRSAAKEYVDRPRKNPVTLQREREEREAEKRRKEKLTKEKEKKTYNYLSKVKAQAPIKKLKKLEELVEIAEEPVKKMPTTWWGRFIKWLNT
jgi:hypothetical protein